MFYQASGLIGVLRILQGETFGGSVLEIRVNELVQLITARTAYDTPCCIKGGLEFFGVAPDNPMLDAGCGLEMPYRSSAVFASHNSPCAVKDR